MRIWSHFERDFDKKGAMNAAKLSKKVRTEKYSFVLVPWRSLVVLVRAISVKR